MVTLKSQVGKAVECYAPCQSNYIKIIQELLNLNTICLIARVPTYKTITFYIKCFAYFQALMGYFYKIESVILIEDVCPLKGEYNSYKEFMEKTKKNYNTVIRISINYAKKYSYFMI